MQIFQEYFRLHIVGAFVFFNSQGDTVWLSKDTGCYCHVSPVGAKRKMEGSETLRFFPAMEEGAEERAQ